MPYDLFISYSRRDNEQGRITQLVERIKKDFASFEGLKGCELVTFFDRDEIHGMSDWRQRILQGLRESRLLLACLSPAYLKSEYCEWEFVEYLKYEIGHLHGFNGVAPIYFVEVPGWDSKEFEQQCAAWIAELRKRQHFDLRPWHDQGEEALRETAVQERMGKLNRQIVQTITRGERAEKSLGNVDAHNPHFIGRTANLRMLRENFVTPGHIGVVTAVNGVGGLGKTALAIEYAHAFADEYGGGRWQVRCAGKDDLRLALAELATPIGFEFSDDEKKNADLQFERTRRELKKLADARAPHRCLLLLDNVDRPGLLEPAQVARLNGGDWLHVLATTRLGENELHGAHRDRSFLAIDELPPDDALALIESYQPAGRFRSEAERDAAREIVRLLGCFTLAVESAAVYLGQFANDVTCAAFLARLIKEGLEGLDTAAGQSSEGVMHGEKRLSATLQPTLERLGAPEKLALEFAALLPPDQVPLPWLRALMAKTFPEMERDAEPGHPDPWKNVARRLFSLRLIQATDVRDSDGQPRVVRIHRLVQEVVLRGCCNIVEELNNQILQTASRRVLEDSLGITSPVEDWELTALFELCVSRMRQRSATILQMSLSVGRTLLRALRFSEALQITEIILKPLEEQYGSTSIEVVSSLNLLGMICLTNANFAEAEAAFTKARQKCECAAEQPHSLLAATLSNLGVLYMETHRLTQAETLLRSAIQMEQQNSGGHSLPLASQFKNLSLTLEWLNRPSEAIVAAKEALRIDQCSYGHEHAFVADDLNSIAGLLHVMGDLEQASATMQKVLQLDRACLPENHPQIATHLSNHARMLDDLGDFTKAEPLFIEALKIDLNRFKSGHPLIALRLNNLAVNLRNQGRLREALPLHNQALKIEVACRGMKHPKVALRLMNLAVTLMMDGDLTSAGSFIDEAWQALDQKFDVLGVRILIVRFVLTVLSKQPHYVVLGQIKTLLQEQRLTAEGIDLAWTTKPVLSWLKTQVLFNIFYPLTKALFESAWRGKVTEELASMNGWRECVQVPIQEIC